MKIKYQSTFAALRRDKQKLLTTVLIGALACVSTVRADDTVATPAATPNAAEAASPALPAATAADDDSWKLAAMVPLWAPQINGNATVKGNQRNVDISFDEIKDHLDASFALALQAQKGKFGIFGDIGYMKFSGDVKNKVAKADFGFIFVVADLGVSYRLIKTESERPFLLAGTLGVRFWYTDLSMTIKDSLGNKLFNGSNYQNLEDPMIGLRGSKYFTKKFHLDFAGDVGGFGIADEHMADLDWSASGVLTYDFFKWFSLSGGYKAIGLDASKGSGAHKNGVDIIFHGFLLAGTFKF